WFVWARRRRSGMRLGNVCLACHGRDCGEPLGQLTAGEPRIPDTTIHAARLLSIFLIYSMSVISAIFLRTSVQRTQHVSYPNSSSKLSDRGAPPLLWHHFG